MKTFEIDDRAVRRCRPDPGRRRIGADDAARTRATGRSRLPKRSTRADKAACDALSGNAKDVCVEEAKGKEKVAKAEAEAAYKNTPKAREKARVARADAAYEVAKEKCDDLAGNAKDVCVKEAKAAHVKAQGRRQGRPRGRRRTRAGAEQTTAAQARSDRGQARRRLQGRDREVRRAGRRRQGRLRPRREGPVRQDVVAALPPPVARRPPLCASPGLHGPGSTSRPSFSRLNQDQ